MNTPQHSVSRSFNEPQASACAISRVPIFSAAIALMLVVSCQRPLPPEQPTQSMVRAPSDDDFRALWDACQAVLRKHRFEIDREDLRAGVITTFPQTSQHFWEFWRHDVDTPYDLAESTLHTIRRSVTVQISRPQDDGEYVVDVTVHKERLHAAERQINNAAAVLRVFSADLPTIAGRKFQRSTDEFWAPAGRDGAMEQRILDLILARSNTSEGR